jgi:hypothetical protein
MPCFLDQQIGHRAEVAGSDLSATYVDMRGDPAAQSEGPVPR